MIFPTFAAPFMGYFSTLGLKKDLVKGSHNKLFWTGVLADWLMAIRSTGLNRPHGPRFYFGFIFAH